VTDINAFNVEGTRMSLRSRSFAAVLLAGVATATSLAVASPAQASINPANCSFHAALPNYIAQCYDTVMGGQSPWHVELTCQRGTHVYTAEGSNAYGTSYSMATCGPYENQELLSYQIIVL